MASEEVFMSREKDVVKEIEKEVSRPAATMGFTVERVSALSDGIFAVAITLLVLSIALPTIHGRVTEAKMAHGLAQVWPHFFAYGLSFIIIGMFWVSHHALFSAIQKVDKTLIWLNMFYLLLIVFMPYPTNVLALFGDTMVATVLYASILAGAAILQAVMGFYAVHNHRLVDDNLDEKEANNYVRHSLLTAAVFLVSIVISQWSPVAAQYFWIVLFLMPIVEHLMSRKKSEEHSMEAEESS
jgi:uncharacterized membrane protein